MLTSLPCGGGSGGTAEVFAKTGQAQVVADIFHLVELAARMGEGLPWPLPLPLSGGCSSAPLEFA